MSRSPRPSRALLALALVAAGLPAAGCTVTQENFGEEMGEAWCDKYQECYRSEFEDDYDSMEECQEDAEDTYDSIQEGANDLGCELDEEEATAYRDELRASECGEFNDQFWLTLEDELWDC